VHHRRSFAPVAARYELIGENAEVIGENIEIIAVNEHPLE
jgi:hypothetical protein